MISIFQILVLLLRPTGTADLKEKSMKTMFAKDAEARFDQFIDAAQQEPVVVAKEDHPVGVFLSIDHLEDTI